MHIGLAHRPFGAGILPRSEAKCVDCDCIIDTQSGLMVAMGNPAKAESPIPIIDPAKE